MKNVSLRGLWPVLISTIVLLFLAGCEPDPFLVSTESSSIQLGPGMSSATISFSTNVSWTAKSSDGWLRVSPSSGEGGEVTVTVSADANTIYSSRTATLTISTEGLSKSFSITQDENKGLLLSETNFSIGSDGGTIRIPVKANLDYVLTVADNAKSWLAVTQTKSLSDYQIVLTAAKNETYDSRTGTVDVKFGNENAVLTVKQSQLDELIVSQTSFEIGSGGGEIQIPVKTNIDYECAVLGSASEWISVKTLKTKGLDDCRLVLSVKANSEYDGRVGQVKMTGAGKESVLTITQSQLDELIVSETAFEIGSAGGEIRVPVKSNVKYECAILGSAADWISVKTVQTKGLEDYQLVLSVSGNKGYDGRVGQVKVTGAGKESVITVTQSQLDELIISETAFEIGSAGGEIQIPVQTNTDYECAVLGSAAEWISVKTLKTKGLDDYRLVLSVTANSEYDGRVGQVKVTGAGKESVITITQSQYDAIFVNQTEYIVDPGGGVIEIPLQSNVPFNVKSEADWIHFIETKTLTGSTILLSVDANLTFDPREGIVHISQQDGPLSYAVRVSQDFRIDDSAEREALISLYKSTGGPRWTNHTNWCSEKPLNQWYGVTTDSKGRVVELNLRTNQLSGKYPTELERLPWLRVLNLENNDLKGTLPDEIGNLSNLKTLILGGNRFSGVIPASIGNLTNLEELDLYANSLTGRIPSEIGNLVNLTFFTLNSTNAEGHVNQITGSLPESMKNLVNLNYLGIADNALDGPLPDWIASLPNLVTLYLYSNNITGSIPESYADAPRLTSLVLAKNRLSGRIPDKILESDHWNKDWSPEEWILPQQDGYGLTFEMYESTDYSHDGEVTKLQTHTKGKGINIVITGDVFVDTDFSSGDFDFAMNQAMEDFFAIEPYKTYRDLFDVYSVGAVSKNPLQAGETAFETFYEGGGPQGDAEKVSAYALKAVDELDETLILVNINNKRRDGGGTCYMYPPYNHKDFGSGKAIAFYNRGSDDRIRRELVWHEAGGHGFGKLLDEYAYETYGRIPPGNIPDKNVPDDGWGKNVDYTSDPEQIKWSKFLKDERYQYDELGIFEGAVLYFYGAWRPSISSVMNTYDFTEKSERFNAPSREAIWYRIHKLAYGDEWIYNYEDFVAYDAINRKTAPSSTAPRGNYVEKVKDKQIVHYPPVIMK